MAVDGGGLQGIAAVGSLKVEEGRSALHGLEDAHVPATSRDHRCSLSGILRHEGNTRKIYRKVSESASRDPWFVRVGGSKVGIKKDTRDGSKKGG